MKSLNVATLIRGVGIEGDRYALETGTYSAKFFGEPGKNLTLVSADGVEAKMAEKKFEVDEKHFEEEVPIVGAAEGEQELESRVK